MAEDDDIRYRNVPSSVPRPLADACYEFGDQIHWLIEDLEDIGKAVFNARLHESPVEWEQRLSEAQCRLEPVTKTIKDLKKKLRLIERQAPK